MKYLVRDDYVESMPFRDLEILDWGCLPYGEAFERQLALVEDRIAGISHDRLVLVEHPHVITIGRSGGLKDLRISREALKQKGVEQEIVPGDRQYTLYGVSWWQCRWLLHRRCAPPCRQQLRKGQPRLIPGES